MTINQANVADLLDIYCKKKLFLNEVGISTYKGDRVCQYCISSFFPLPGSGPKNEQLSLSVKISLFSLLLPLDKSDNFFSCLGLYITSA